VVEAAALGALDLRAEGIDERLRAGAPSALGAVVLSGTVEGMAGGERAQLLDAVGARLAPGGTLLVHSATREAWESTDAPPEADLAPGRPLRPEAWCRLLEQSGYDAEVQRGPGGADYLVVAVRSALTAAGTPARR